MVANEDLIGVHRSAESVLKGDASHGVDPVAQLSHLLCLLLIKKRFRAQIVLFETVDQRYEKFARVVDGTLFGDHNETKVVVHRTLDAVCAQTEIDELLAGEYVIVLVERVVETLLDVADLHDALMRLMLRHISL